MSVYDSHKPEDFEGRQREVLAIYTRLHKAMQAQSQSDSGLQEFRK